MILLSACLCSIDTVASEESVDENKYPKLHSIILGEGIFKDCVTIVLFRSILEQMVDPKKFTLHWYTSLNIILGFLKLIVGSLVFGVVAGLLTTYLLKKCRFLLHDKGIT